MKPRGLLDFMDEPMRDNYPQYGGVPLLGVGGNHPITGRPYMAAPEGGVATERGISVSDPRLNGGAATNLPSIWGGMMYDPKDAVSVAMRQQNYFPSFQTMDRAVQSSIDNSRNLGFFMPTFDQYWRDQ